ncbi:hypothetical protein [Tumebacillus lipolyticus]|uniref:Uncharacterized protein n=1 Tax=Tumebacillus lipolyticus TaxID=1280370 RepID=A0ABW4ZTE7_9BACL
MQKRTQRRQRRLKGRQRPVYRTSPRSWVLDGDMRKMIREEAVKLKLSEEEYLRLMLHFSEVVRTSILPAGVLDGGFLTMILQNPMVLNMLKGMISNMFQGAMNKSKSVSSDGKSGLPTIPNGGQFQGGRFPSGGQMMPSFPGQGGMQQMMPPAMMQRPMQPGGPGMPGMPGMSGMPFGPHPIGNPSGSQGQQRNGAMVGMPQQARPGSDGGSKSEGGGISGEMLDQLTKMVGQWMQK